MKEPKLNDVRKYLNAIVKMNKKYITTERLSKVYTLDILHKKILAWFRKTKKTVYI